MKRALRIAAALPGMILCGLALVLTIAALAVATLIVPARFLKETHHGRKAC